MSILAVIFISLYWMPVVEWMDRRSISPFDISKCHKEEFTLYS